MLQTSLGSEGPAKGLDLRELAPAAAPHHQVLLTEESINAFNVDRPALQAHVDHPVTVSAMAMREIEHSAAQHIIRIRPCGVAKRRGTRPD